MKKIKVILVILFVCFATSTFAKTGNIHTGQVMMPCEIAVVGYKGTALKVQLDNCQHPHFNKRWYHTVLYGDIYFNALLEAKIHGDTIIVYLNNENNTIYGFEY